MAFLNGNENLRYLIQPLDFDNVIEPPIICLYIYITFKQIGNF